MARAHGRLTVRRRRGAARSRRRRHRGRGRTLPLAPPADGAARRGRGVSGARRRVALRQGDELEGIDHDRLRAPLQPDAVTRRTGCVRGRVGGDRRAEAAQPGSHRRAQPRSVRRCAPRGGGAAGSPDRGAAARRPSGVRPPRRPRPRRGERAGLRHELRDEGRVRHRPGRARVRARRDRRGGGERDPRSALGRLPRDRRVRARRRPPCPWTSWTASWRTARI